eukprot:63887-Hanusia_phi.AAC.1
MWGRLGCQWTSRYLGRWMRCHIRRRRYGTRCPEKFLVQDANMFDKKQAELGKRLQPTAYLGLQKARDEGGSGMRSRQEGGCSLRPADPTGRQSIKGDLQVNAAASFCRVMTMDFECHD